MTEHAILVSLDVVTAGTFALLAIVAVRHRDRPGAAVAGTLWVSLAALSGVLVGNRLGLLGARAAATAILSGWVVATTLWAGFVFTYTRRGPTPTRRRIAFAACYVAVVSVTTVFGITGTTTASSVIRLVMAVLQTVLLGVGLFGVFLVIRAALVDTDPPLGEAIVLSGGGLCVTLSLLSVSTLSTFGPEPLPSGVTGVLAVSAGGFAIAVFGFSVFDRAPATGPLARQSVLETMREAVVVVDRDGRLVDANEAAEHTFGISLGADAGQPVASVLDAAPDTLAGESVTLSTAAGTRQFDVSHSVLTDRRGETVGSSYLFRDVTDQQTRQQRLEVLNRVLRHNLRNDLDAIRGFAEGLSDGVVEDTDTATARIHSTASELVDIGETVERADRVVTRAALNTESVDLVALSRAVVSDIEHQYDFDASVSAPREGVSICTDREVLRTALREIVENAAEHGDSPVPTVSIEIAENEKGGEIVVCDDGPGIPEQERAVLLDGAESPLRHGSGVGLWFVSWAVTRLGGDLELATPDDGGSDVRLTLPDEPRAG